MSKNIKNCRLAFKYQEKSYSSDCWNLFQMNLHHKFKERMVVGENWRNLVCESGISFYSIGLTSVMRNNKVYDSIMAISHSKKPCDFSMVINAKLPLSGAFIINKTAVEADKFGLLHMKINLESHGEIKNEYNYNH